MIHDKVFALIWLWHCFIVVMGVVRLLTRSPQLVSAEVRIFIVTMPCPSLGPKHEKLFKFNLKSKAARFLTTFFQPLISWRLSEAVSVSIGMNANLCHTI